MQKHYLLLFTAVFILLHCSAQQKPTVEAKKDTGAEYYTAKQIISSFNTSSYDKSLIFSTGIDAGFSLGTNGKKTWMVTSVAPGSDAWFKGIEVDDILTLADWTPPDHLPKSKLIELLTGSFNKEIYTRILKKIDGAYVSCDVKLNCNFLMNRPDSFKKGKCFSGDCNNGTGAYIDASGNISYGTFANGKLTGTCYVIKADGSAFLTNGYTNGIKEGLAGEQYGRGKYILVSGTPVLTRNSFQSYTYGDGYLNGLRTGKNSFTKSGSLNSYFVQFEMGKLVKGARTEYSDGSYCTCTADGDTPIIKCFTPTGTAVKFTDLKELTEKNAVASPNNTTTASKLNADNTTINTQEEGPYIGQNLQIAADKLKQQENGNVVWKDGGLVVFRSNGFYDRKYESFTVPAHKRLKVYFLMQNSEPEKVKFVQHRLSYNYSKMDGGPATEYNGAIGDLVWSEVFSVYNAENMEGHFSSHTTKFINVNRLQTRSIRKRVILP